MNNYDILIILITGIVFAICIGLAMIFDGMRSRYAMLYNTDDDASNDEHPDESEHRHDHIREAKPHAVPEAIDCVSVESSIKLWRLEMTLAYSKVWDDWNEDLHEKTIVRYLDRPINRNDIDEAIGRIEPVEIRSVRVDTVTAFTVPRLETKEYHDDRVSRD